MAERLERFAAQAIPQPPGDLAERRLGDDLAVALARPAGVDDLDEAAGPRRHGADPVGQHRRLVERVSDEEHGGAGGAPQPQHFVAHQEPGLRVERAERLVEQDQARLQHERARNADALAHAARQLRRIGAGEVFESHEGQRIVDAAAYLGLGDAAAAQAERGIVPYRQPGEAGVLLEDDANTFGDFAADRLAFERHRARGRPLQAGEHFEERRLAAARRPDHGEELALAQVQIDRPERVDRRLIAGAGKNARYG